MRSVTSTLVCVVTAVTVGTIALALQTTDCVAAGDDLQQAKLKDLHGSYSKYMIHPYVIDHYNN